jgi:hypothetical protein
VIGVKARHRRAFPQRTRKVRRNTAWHTPFVASSDRDESSRLLEPEIAI